MTSAPSTSVDRVPAQKPSDIAPRGAEPARKQGERRNLGDSFAGKLKQAAAEDGKGVGSTVHRSGTEAGRRQRPLDNGEQRQSGEGDGSAAQMQRQVAGIDRQASIAESARTEAFDRALFDRIAARIAEVQPGQAGSQVRIDLPLGQLAETVHLRREADGSMAIRVCGNDPRLSPSAQGMARQALEAALLRRKLRVSSLTFEDADRTGQRSRSSARSRVV